MILNESYSNVIVEAKVVYARRGKTVTTKFRCTAGPRKGRVVASPAQCSKPIDLKKRFTLKKTRASKGSRMTKKAQRTKRINPQSKIVRQLNKARR
jgi:hypothetical protein|tara:strand:+ start:438 stop:725 length:288 start_codon:yes stop_codon:yes gene_type:complete